MRGKFEDLTNKEFNGVKVINFAEKYGKTNATIWNCLCFCGKEFKQRTNRIINNENLSCGCLRGKKVRYKYNDPKVASWQNLIGLLKSSSKFRKINWELTDEETIDLLKGNCVYCGRKPYRTYNRYKNIKYNNRPRQKEAEIFINGIDRIDSAGSYTRENTVSCCTICNFAKNDLGLDEFKKWIKDLVEYQIKL